MKTRIEYACRMPCERHKHGEYYYWHKTIDAILPLSKGDSIGPFDPVFGVEMDIESISFDVAESVLTVRIDTHDVASAKEKLSAEEYARYLSQTSEYHAWLESIGYVKEVEIH